MMAGAIVAAAFRVAVIDVRVKSFSSGVFELLVSHGAKRHALVFARRLIAQNGVVFLAADFRALKPDELIIVGVFNDHS